MTKIKLGNFTVDSVKSDLTLDDGTKLFSCQCSDGSNFYSRDEFKAGDVVAVYIKKSKFGIGFVYELTQ